MISTQNLLRLPYDNFNFSGQTNFFPTEKDVCEIFILA
jgi:hypothetical protein